MEQTSVALLFSLMRSAMWESPLTDAEKELSQKALPQAAALACKHDLGHLLAKGVKYNGLPCLPEWEKEQIKAIYRYEQLNYELEQTCMALEQEGIPFLPLKGSVLRKDYPQPWMRTSCDIDILISESDLERATARLLKDCNYTCTERGSHDVSFRTPSGMHLELHYDLVEEGRANTAPAVLREVWAHTKVAPGAVFRREMTDAMFYFYHIAHMAKHFENGGCGIRPFLDLWILDGKKEVDLAARQALLGQGGLSLFAQSASQLSRVWFGEAPCDALTARMEEYILTGGMYGTVKNRVTVQQKKKGGRIGYVFSRLFLPYEQLKSQYPVLKKHPWLMPLMQLRRWFKSLFGGGVKRSVHELQTNRQVSAKEVGEMQEFLHKIGL